MKIAKITSIAAFVLIIASCSSRKKNTTSTVMSAPVSPTTATNNVLVARSATGVYVPGNEELTAILVQYNDVTLEKLKEGYTIYAEGACMKCHGAANIYQRGEARWKSIIDDMAFRANLSDGQKDAVYKYVLAIKAVQPK